MNPLSIMSKEQAKNFSAQARDTGWVAWLVKEIHTRAELKFAEANPNDAAALKDARMLYEAATLVDTIIQDNAR